MKFNLLHLGCSTSEQHKRNTQVEDTMLFILIHIFSTNQLKLNSQVTREMYFKNSISSNEHGGGYYW